jgi:hypothetical protein
MRLVLNMATMAKGGFSRAGLEKTKQLIKKPRVEVPKEKEQTVEFPWHQKVEAAIERHPEMVYKNYMAGCLLCQNGTAKYLQTCGRRKETAAAPPELAAAPPRMPSLPRMPPAPPDDTEGNESYEIEGMPSRSVYMHFHFHTLNSSIIMHMPRIASPIKILFQIS